MSKKWTPEKIQRILELYDTHTYDQIGKILKKEFGGQYTGEVVRKALKRNVNKTKTKYRHGHLPKILIFDIETSPIEARVWSIWNQDIPISRILKDWTVLAWAAKWLGDDPDKTVYMDTFHQKDKYDDSKILKNIHKLLDEADIVIGHNSDAFDVKKLNARFIQHGMKPPSSYKRLDTKKLAKKYFAFTSNKLEYITDRLCTKYKKLKHGKFPGNALWDEFLAGNKEAQKEMEIYNKYDVLSLEEAFLKILPWESASLFEAYRESDIPICTCGSIDFKKNGYYYTTTNKYKKYTCNSCGAETRDKNGLITTKNRDNQKRNTAR